MKYFGEEPDYLLVKCEKCGKVLKVKKESAEITPYGYYLYNPLMCFCGETQKDVKR